MASQVLGGCVGSALRFASAAASTVAEFFPSEPSHKVAIAIAQLHVIAVCAH